MRQIILFFLIVSAVTAFSQPAKIDPYFVETRDTVSVHGPMSITRHLLEDKKGNIWIASWQGIMKYDGKVFTNYTLKENLIHFHVYSIMEDRSGNIWFGTIRGGAYKYDPLAELRQGRKTFTLFTSKDGLVDDLIGCMMEDKEGKIWFGTDGGVSVFDTSASFRTRENSAVATISGLSLTSKKGFTNYTTGNGLSGDRVNSIMQDRTGKIWIGTRSGVSCFDGKSFSDFKIEPGVPFSNVRSIKEDRNGKIWIGGQEGLYCYDPLETGGTALKQLMSNFIGYIYEDKTGNLWVSAGETKGMSLYMYDHKNFKKILEKNSERDFQVFEMTEDKNGNIWVSTMRGPCRYDGKTFTYFAR